MARTPRTMSVMEIQNSHLRGARWRFAAPLTRGRALQLRLLAVGEEPGRSQTDAPRAPTLPSIGRPFPVVMTVTS
jgi:hypothetical protein